MVWSPEFGMSSRVGAAFGGLLVVKLVAHLAVFV